MRPRTDRRRRWKRRWAERRGATENQRRCVRVPRRINVWGYYYPQTFPFSQTLSNRDKHESFLGSFIFPFPNLRFPFSQINKLIFLKKIRHFSKYSSISRSRWQTTYRDTLQNQLSIAVYNFMQTRKKRETAHEVRGTSACADRSGAQTSNLRAQDWARKKERYRFGIVLFSSARRGSNPRPPPWQGGAPPLSHSRISYRSKPVS